MPTYSFLCDQCVLEFNRVLKMGDHATHKCPSCTLEAPRLWEQQSLSFGFAESATASPANSGVHKDDYPTADHIVGRDATKRWEQISEREKVKTAARQQGGTHALIRHPGQEYIDYEPMSKQGMNARRNLARTTLEAVRLQKETQRSQKG